jgi:predicted nucleic acid-binding protein
MPTYRIPEAHLELPRNLALLDTNVLIALADKDDSHHMDAQAVFELEENYNWMVIPSVLVETWGLLVGSRKKWDAALGLFTWLLTPGNVTLLPDAHRPLRAVIDMAWRNKIDLVDAQLVDMADSITGAFRAKPFIFIATFDTGDFLRCKTGDTYRFSLYDMNIPEPLPFEK